MSTAHFLVMAVTAAATGVGLGVALGLAGIAIHRRLTRPPI